MPESAPVPAAERRHRVLVVDDVKLIGTMVQRMLAAEREIEVHFRRTAATALEAAVSLGLHSEAHTRLLERNAAFAALERANADLGGFTESTARGRAARGRRFAR